MTLVGKIISAAVAVAVTVIGNAAKKGADRTIERHFPNKK